MRCPLASAVHALAAGAALCGIDVQYGRELGDDFKSYPRHAVCPGFVRTRIVPHEAWRQITAMGYVLADPAEIAATGEAGQHQAERDRAQKIAEEGGRDHHALNRLAARCPLPSPPPQAWEG